MDFMMKIAISVVINQVAQVVLAAQVVHQALEVDELMEIDILLIQPQSDSKLWKNYKSLVIIQHTQNLLWTRKMFRKIQIFF